MLYISFKTVACLTLGLQLATMGLFCGGSISRLACICVQPDLAMHFPLR